MEPTITSRYTAYSKTDDVFYVSSATPCNPLLQALLAAFQASDATIPCQATVAGDASAFAFLMSSRAAATLSEDEISPFDTVPYRKLIGSAPFAIKVATCLPCSAEEKSASAAVYVHRDNPLASLSVAMLSRIFTSGNPGGDISTWGQAGLSGLWRQRAIHPLRLPETAPLSLYVKRHHFTASEPGWNGEYADNTDDLMARLALTPNGIGIAEAGRETDQVRALSLNNSNAEQPIAATHQQIIAGHYPFTRHLLLYVPLDRDKRIAPQAARFCQYLLSPAAQTIIATHPRYAPLHPALHQQQSTLVAEHL